MKWPFKRRSQSKIPMGIDDGLRAATTAAAKASAAAGALESTNIDAFHKASMIAYYEPKRFENDAEYSEARIARDALADAHNAASDLKEASLYVSITLKINGHDLLAASFAEVASKAIKIGYGSVFEKAAGLQDACRQAFSSIEEYYAD